VRTETAALRIVTRAIERRPAEQRQAIVETPAGG
jgi:DNA-directed RNA polymerase specialized sigma24 family protein